MSDRLVFRFTKHDPTVRDFFQFHIFFTNWIGFQFHLMGYGLSFRLGVFKP